MTNKENKEKLSNAKTFTELADAIKPLLGPVVPSPSPEDSEKEAKEYEQYRYIARQTAIRLYEKYSTFDLPPFPPKSETDLSAIRVLCIAAQKVIDKATQPKLMAINVIPAHFDVSNRTLYRWIDKGQLTLHRDKNGKIMVDAVEVAKYAAPRRKYN